MSDGLKDILSNLNKDIEQEKLLQYLNRQLPEQEHHDFEAQMNDDEFMNDAVEGLQALENRDKIPALVNQLNAGLKKELEKKNRKKTKREIKELPWIYFTIILLLLLVITAYFIIRKLL